MAEVPTNIVVIIYIKSSEYLAPVSDYVHPFDAHIRIIQFYGKVQDFIVDNTSHPVTIGKKDHFQLPSFGSVDTTRLHCLIYSFRAFLENNKSSKVIVFAP